MGYIGNQDYNMIETNIGTVTGTDTAAKIAALPNDNGALWLASDTGHLFLNDGFKWHDLGRLQGDTGPQGVGVKGISKTSTSGLVDTYTVTFSDMSTTTYTITNGKGIVGVARTSGDGSEGTLDTYTITYNDSTTSTYDVYNGKNKFFKKPWTLYYADWDSATRDSEGFITDMNLIPRLRGLETPELTEYSGNSIRKMYNVNTK